MTKSKGASSSAKLEVRLRELTRCLSTSSMALLIWDRLLTNSDKRKLGNNLERQYAKLGTIGIWMKLRQLPEDAAIIDLSHEVDLITEAERNRLVRKLGRDTLIDQEKREPDRPVWDAVVGQLFWGEAVIRRVKSGRRSNIRKILDAFETHGWPPSIPDPLSGLPDPECLHQTAYSLNKGLEVVRFHVAGGGNAIHWELVGRQASAP